MSKQQKTTPLTRYQEILSRELTRKQFLQVVGVGLVSVLGFNNLLSMLMKLNKPANGAQRADRGSSFGGGRFGV